MFVQGYYDRVRDKVLVSERLDNGKRILNEFAPIYEFYVDDKEYGEYISIYGDRVRKVKAHNKNEWFALKKQYEGIKTYEKNFNIVNKVLYANYRGAGVPKLHKSFIDIEVDRAGFEYLTIKELIDKACCPVNAVSVYNDWEDKLWTFMLCPETLDFNEAKKICDKFENCFLFESESDLLACLMGVLDDMDCISSWNGTNFDYPYIVRRIENVLGQGQSAGLCLWGVAPRCMEKKGDFGETHLEYDFVGKWFSDYLLLYKKHERGKKESYKLDSIAELELGENKVQHEESLEDMYRQRYEDFIKYNRQDTMLVKRLDDKLKYLEIHCIQSHEIFVNMEQTMGTVGWMDTAFSNRAHNMGKVIQDKDEFKGQEFKDMIPPGAHCPEPIPGLHKNIMSFDMHAMYPSSCRALNMSPETIVAQVRLTLTIPYINQKVEEGQLWKNKTLHTIDWGAVWGDVWCTLEYDEIMKQSDTPLILDVANGQSISTTAKKIYEIIFKENSNLCISALGTIFKTDEKGLIPMVFEEWDIARDKYKKLKNKYADMLDGVIIDQDMISKLS